jgi:hypothetical protein
VVALRKASSTPQADKVRASQSYKAQLRPPPILATTARECHMRTAIALFFAAAAATSAVRAAPAPSELAWLAGDWRLCREGEIVEERWLGPRGDVLLGASLTSSKDGKASWEHLRIARDGDTWVYWASPEGRTPVPFRLVESAPGRAVFANPERPFPSRIVYWRDGVDLIARIEGTVQDRAVAREWRYSQGTAADCVVAVR